MEVILFDKIVAHVDQQIRLLWTIYNVHRYIN